MTALREWYRSLIPSGDRHFASRPGAMLKAYTQDRRQSVLARMFHVANRLQACVDTVVVLCQRDSGLGAQAFMQACCQPYWNLLSRADRGSKPRMFFIASDCDNDKLQGLLHLLGTFRQPSKPTDIDRWALLVLSPSSVPTLDSFWQLKPLLQALQAHVDQDGEDLSRRLMGVVPGEGPLRNQLKDLGVEDLFEASDEPSPMQCFGPLGLLPATLLGVNVMELTAGAAWMSDHLVNADSEPNLVSRFMRWRDGEALGQRQRTACRAWNSGLDAWVRWMESVDRCYGQETVYSSDGPESQSDKEWHIVVDHPRFDPVFLESSETAPRRIRQSIDRDQQLRRAAGSRIAEMRLSVLDELHIGQLMQFYLLASAP
jgi:glucose-6-phosphate isomerase